MDAAELHEWLVYEQLEPFGEIRADLRMGIVAATMANLWADRKNGQPFTPADFVPNFSSPPPTRYPVNTPEMTKASIAAFRLMTQLAGGSIQPAAR